MTILRPQLPHPTFSFPADRVAFFKHFPSVFDVTALDPWMVRAMRLPEDETFWSINETFGYLSDKFGMIESPKGAITNLASVPKKARGFLDNDGPKIMFGSIPHDRLCTANGKGERGWIDDRRRLSFKSTNEVLTEAMFYLGASAALRAIVFEAVTFGNQHAAKDFPPHDIL